MSPHVNDSRFSSDLDRVLGEWFADGPRRAPEAPMTAAVEWARSHPRRRDPFQALRSDPMGGRSFFAPLLQPAWAAAIVGMLLIAVVAIGVGSKPDQQPPPPTATASPSPTATPRPTPTPAPTAFPVELEAVVGVTPTVDVLDETGTLLGARSGTPVDGGVVNNGVLQVTQVDATTIELEWTALGCEDRYPLTIEAGPTITLEQPRCDGDLLPIDRRLVLEFTGPVDASTIVARIVATG